MASDHAIVREGLRAILAEGGWDGAGQALHGLDVAPRLEQPRPEVLVMDMVLPNLDGIEAIRLMRAHQSNVKIVALSTQIEELYIASVLAAGADAHVSKSAPSEELLRAISAVSCGEQYLSSPKDTNPPSSRAGRELDGSKSYKRLSSRESDVLRLIADGKSSKDIANALKLALPTVETYRRQIMTKLGLRTIAQLTKYAIYVGLTSPDPENRS